MAAANELIMIFIGLEISSIASYVLAGYLRDDKRANEAALKYFLLGSFATAFFLYGVALDLRAHGHDESCWRSATLLMPGGAGSAGCSWRCAAALMFVGLGFKVSSAPFQVWAPDVYQGAPIAGDGVPLDGPEGGGVRHLPADLHDAPSSPSAARGSRWCGSPRWPP